MKNVVSNSSDIFPRGRDRQCPEQNRRAGWFPRAGPWRSEGCSASSRGGRNFPGYRRQWGRKRKGRSLSGVGGACGIPGKGEKFRGRQESRNRSLGSGHRQPGADRKDGNTGKGFDDRPENKAHRRARPMAKIGFSNKERQKPGQTRRLRQAPWPGMPR